MSFIYKLGESTPGYKEAKRSASAREVPSQLQFHSRHDLSLGHHPDQTFGRGIEQRPAGDVPGYMSTDQLQGRQGPAGGGLESENPRFKAKLDFMQAEQASQLANAGRRIFDQHGKFTRKMLPFSKPTKARQPGKAKQSLQPVNSFGGRSRSIQLTKASSIPRSEFRINSGNIRFDFQNQGQQIASRDS